MSSFDHKVKTPTDLIEDEQSWQTMRIEFLRYAGAAGVGSNIYELQLPEDTPDNNAARNRLINDDLKLSTALLSLLSKKLKRAMFQEIDENFCTHQIWTWLSNKFASVQTEEAQELKMDEIKLIKIENCDNLKDLDLQLTTAFGEYTAVGGTLSNSKKKSLLIHAAKGLYRNQCDTLSMLGTDVTYDDVLTRLKQAEIDSQLENSRQSKASVNKVQTHKRSSQCFCCLNPMHMVRNCPFYPGSGSWCLHCRDVSHWTINRDLLSIWR